jgi:hypothetical protein
MKKFAILTLNKLLSKHTYTVLHVESGQMFTTPDYGVAGQCCVYLRAARVGHKCVKSY